MQPLHLQPGWKLVRAWPIRMDVDLVTLLAQLLASGDEQTDIMAIAEISRIECGFGFGRRYFCKSDCRPVADHNRIARWAREVRADLNHAVPL